MEFGRETELDRSIRTVARMRPTESQIRLGYAQRISYNGRAAWLFPKAHSNFRSPEIPRDIRRGQGIEPPEEELSRLKVVAKLLETSVTRYVPFWALCWLMREPAEKVANWVIWLVRHGKAVPNVDRWGRAVFVKLNV